MPSATLRSRRAAGLSRTLLLVRDGGHLPNPGEFATAAEQAAPSRYDVTVTIARDGDYLPGPPEFALGAEQAALSRTLVA